MSKLMEYKGYHAKSYYDPDDKIFVGEVIGIEDSLNFHGYSAGEMEEMFHQSVDNYLEFCKKAGVKPNKEFSGVFSVRIPSDVHRLLYFEAEKQNISLNRLVAKILSDEMLK